MNRKLLILSLCFFLSSNLFSQGLNLSNLMKLRTMDNDEINDYLIPKGWKFIGDKNNCITWAYGKSNEKAQFWLNKYYEEIWSPFHKGSKLGTKPFYALRPTF